MADPLKKVNLHAEAEIARKKPHTCN